MLFISFSCLIVVVRTSNTVLNTDSESGAYCSDLKRKSFNFLLLNMMLGVGLSYMFLITLRYFPSIPTYVEFLQ